MTRAHRLLAAAVLALALCGLAPARADALSLAQVHSLWAIRLAAQHWGVSAQYLDCLAWHESTMTPWALGAAGEVGLFQELPSTFYAWSPNALDTAKGPWDAWSNADVAAFLVSRGQSHQWTTTAYCGYWYTAYGH